MKYFFLVCLGVLIGMLLGAYAQRGYEDNHRIITVIHSWHDKDQEMIDVKIGSGLARALAKCAKYAGQASLQGSVFAQELTCDAKEATYVYEDWKWLTDMTLELK